MIYSFAFEVELDRVQWTSLRAAAGRSAAEVPDALRRLAAATDEKEARAAYWGLDNYVVVQATVYEAGPYVVPFMLQLLLSAPIVVQRRALELLIQLTGGYTAPEEEAVGNFDLVRQCRTRTREGLAIIYWLLGSEDNQVRDRSVELLDYVETDADRLIWMLRRFVETEQDLNVTELVLRIVTERQATPS